MLLDRIGAGALLRGTGWQRARFDSEKREGWRWYSIPKRLQTVLAFTLGIALLLTVGWRISLWRADVAARKLHAHHERSEKHLVIASYTAQNVSWLDDVPTAWTVKRYMMDDPDAQSPPLPVPVNQGREAMAYLTYIIDHYDSLPDYMIFTHGHERSWHQQEHLQQKIRALNLTALDEENYISLRCGVQMGCEKLPYIDTRHVNWSGEAGLCHFWEKVTGKRCPRYISYKCCAQHAVTRAAVRTRSKAAWERIRAPIMAEKMSDDNWLTGIFYEKTWHMMFGMPPEHCPSIERCQQVHFSNAIVCDGDTDLTAFEGQVWRDVKCVSAFDDIGRDDPPGPAMKEFSQNILHTFAQMRRAASERHQAQIDAWKAQLEQG